MLEKIAPQMSWATVILALGAIYVVNKVLKYKRDEQAIQKLGHHAPIVRSWAPLGLDVIFRGIYCHLQHRDASFWNHMFSYASPTSPTVEVDMGERVILTADPDNLRAILATQFDDFGKGEEFRQDWHAILGDSVFSMDGAQWHAARHLLRPQFVKNRISDLDVFEMYGQVLLGALAGGEEAIANPDKVWKAIGKEIDMSDLIHRYTLDTSTDFLLGKSVDSLHNPNNEFAEAFDLVQRIQSIRTRAGPAKFLWPESKMQHSTQVINAVAYPYIDAVLRLPPSALASHSSNTSYTFLHALATTSRDRVFLRDQLVSILLAGRDTTAAILTWTFYELARHPSCYAKLRADVVSALGPTHPPTYEHLKNMRYLQHTINEVLRLYPLPFNVRIALKDTTLPRGAGPDGSLPVAVPRDTAIGFSTFHLHRRQDLMPEPTAEFPGVDVFSPERWEDWHPKPWNFVPFSGGPRICLGQQFALAEMGYIIARIVQRFARVEWRGAEADVRFKTDIMIEPVNHLKLAFWE